MKEEPIIARRILVRGRVQGVAFRWHSRDVARDLGLVGWVRNLTDGSVELQLEGAPAEIERMQAWLERGPSGARVIGLEACDAPLEGAGSFEILR